MYRLTLQAAVVAMVFASTAVAQTPGPAPDSATLAALARLTPGAAVRLSAGMPKRVQGTLRSWTWSDSTVLIAAAPGTTVTSVAVGAIDTLWVRGRATGTGAVVGAVTVGLLGAAAGAASCGLANSVNSLSGQSQQSCAGPVAGGGLLGVGVGLGLGALVGSAFPKWRRVAP